MSSQSRVDAFELLDGHRLRRAVSSKSIFGDDSWYLDDSNPAANPRVIHWIGNRRGGVALGREENATLMDACKEYIYLRLNGEGRLAKLKAGTVEKHANALLRICDWMVTVGITAFSEIGRAEIHQLRETMRAEVGVWHCGSNRVLGTKKRRNRSIEKDLEPLRAMVYLRDFLDDVPDWNPDFDQGRLDPSEDENGEIPAIPDEIGIPLLAEALRWVTEIGPPLIRAKEMIWQTYDNDFGRRPFEEISGATRVWRGREVLKRLTDAPIVFSGEPVFLASLSKHEFNKIVRLLETACFIVMAGFTGMRISEMSGIETDCLEVRRAADGVPQLWIKTRLVKAVQGEPRADAWIAGHDAPDHPVRLAVGVATAITSFERENYGLTALFISNASTLQTQGLRKSKSDSRTTHTPGPLTGITMNTRLNDFLAFIGLGTSWHLTTHQFRKFFARFVARLHPSAPLALKRHFKHMSLAMTGLYFGTDTKLLELVSQERRFAAEEALEQILGAAFLGGKMGEQIVKHNERFRGHAGALPLKSYVRTLLNNCDIPMISTTIGFCFAFPDTARCGLDAAKQGYEGCLPCSNFIVAIRHLPAWKERVEMMNQFREQMIAENMWSDSRDADWQRRHDATIAVIHGLEQQMPRAVKRTNNEAQSTAAKRSGADAAL